jgi:hypothetical protein
MRIAVLSLCVTTLLISGCASSRSPSSGSDESPDGQDGTFDGDRPDGSDDNGVTTDGEDGNDDGTDGGGTGVIPPCQFPIAPWFECNPWPNCPASGCAGGQICTLVYPEGPPKMTCWDPGAIPLGGACNHKEGGPFCTEGICANGHCRAFCNDANDCESAACLQIATGGALSWITACGSTQSACDPLDAANSCGPGMACYLQPNGLTDCQITKQSGAQDDVCDCPNCCAPGLTCIVFNDQPVCGQTCGIDAGEPSCQGCENGYKNLNQVIGACTPKDEGGGTDGGNEPVPCNILEQDCAGVAQGCYSTDKGDVCLSKGNQPKGSICKNVNDCAVGTTCVAGKCKAICDPNNPQNNENCDVTQFLCAPLQNSAGGYCDE